MDKKPTELRVVDRWGKSRKAKEITCKYCGQKAIKRLFSDRPAIYCKQSCATADSFKGKIINCLNCKVKIKRSVSKIHKRNFCSRKCKDKYDHAENHPNWKGGLSSYRDRAIREYGLSCSNKGCPISFEIPKYMYEVDHIDGNRNNNKIQNLRILCSWCHRVKTITSNPRFKKNK